MDQIKMIWYLLYLYDDKASTYDVQDINICLFNIYVAW